MFLIILFGLYQGKLKWLRQTAWLIVQVERYLLTDSERTRRKDWFPIWFQYSLNEMEQHEWQEKVKLGPSFLRWAPKEFTVDQNNYLFHKQKCPKMTKEIYCISNILFFFLV